MSYIDYETTKLDEDFFKNIVTIYTWNRYQRENLEKYIYNSYKSNNISEKYIETLKSIIKMYEISINNTLLKINNNNDYILYSNLIYHKLEYRKYLIYGINTNIHFFINKYIIDLINEYNLINNNNLYATYFIEKINIIKGLNIVDKKLYILKLKHNVLQWFNKCINYNYAPIIYNYIIFTNPLHLYNRKIKKLLKLCVQNINTYISSTDTYFAKILKQKIVQLYPLFKINKYLFLPNSN